jgi:hypothetical protein
MCGRVSVPHAGSASRNVRAHTGPMPGTLCHKSSCSRHRGLARSLVARSSSNVARRALSQAIGASLSWGRRPLVLARRCCSAVRMPISGWRRPRSARSSRVWASGRGRGGGRSTSAQCARARASKASVWANCPVARAQSRACSGCTTTTGRPAVAHAAGAPRSSGVVASHTSRGGGGAATVPRASRLQRRRSARPSALQRGAPPCLTGLGPHQDRHNRARHSYALLSARPCRDGLYGTTQRSGLEESRP